MIFFDFSYNRFYLCTIMSSQDRKISRKRIAGAYVSSVISISLVLMMVGIATLLVVNARSAADYFKESLQISVLMKPGVGEEKAEAWRVSLENEPFLNSSRLVSREEGTEELKKMLGEDFLKVFETSPVPVGVDITLKAQYVSADSLEVVTAALKDSPLVDEVACQRSLVDALNANLTKISLVIGVFIALMLFISVVLIGGTVRLNLQARRFTVRTMRLVGATKNFIRLPFVRDALFQGLAASLLALAVLGAGLLYVKKSFGELFEIFSGASFVRTGVIIVVCGVLLCVAATWFTVGRLVSMSRDEMYY